MEQNLHTIAPKTNRRGLLIIGIVCLLAILVGLLAVSIVTVYSNSPQWLDDLFASHKKTDSTQQEEHEETPLSLPISEPISDPLSQPVAEVPQPGDVVPVDLNNIEWEIYRNTEYGWSIKYPKGWYVYEIYVQDQFDNDYPYITISNRSWEGFALSYDGPELEQWMANQPWNYYIVTSGLRDSALAGYNTLKDAEIALETWDEDEKTEMLLGKNTFVVSYPLSAWEYIVTYAFSSFQGENAIVSFSYNKKSWEGITTEDIIDVFAGEDETIKYVVQEMLASLEEL